MVTNNTQTTESADYPELMEKRGQLITELEKLVENPEGKNAEGEASGVLSDEQRSRYDRIDESIDSLDKQIEIKGKAFERRNQQNALDWSRRVPQTPGIVPEPANKGLSDGEARDVRSFNLGRAIRLAYLGRPIDGIEGELIKEGADEVRQCGQDISTPPNGFVVPRGVFQKLNTHASTLEQRDMTATGPGKAFVSEQSLDIVEAMFESLHVVQMGAVVYDNMIPNAKIPRIEKSAPPTGKAENAQADSHTWTTQKVDLTPKRLPVKIVYSRQLMIQSQDRNLEMFIRRYGVDMLSAEMEKAVANGTGTNEATGIIGFSGVAAVEAGDTPGADGNPIVWQNIVDLEAGPDGANADDMNRYYWFNSDIKKSLKTTPLVTSTDSRMILEQGQGRTLNDTPFRWSNAVPNDLTKGSGTNLSAIIYGQFMGYAIANYTGIEIIVDSVTPADTGEIFMHLAVYYDGIVQDPNKFAVLADAVT